LVKKLSKTKENEKNECGGQKMNVTLEDVLYLTNLPIVGRAVVPNIIRTKKLSNEFFQLMKFKIRLP
jgi:hypothetical protein